MENKGFKSRFGFIMAAAGSAIGLGNLWAFPYKAGVNGGAAFVLIYVLMAIIVGFVGMIAEMYVGKRTGRNIIDSYTKASKGLTWVGVLTLLSTIIIASYYIVIGGWVLKYAFSYLVGTNLAIDGSYSAYFTQFSQSVWEPIIYITIFFALAMLVLIFGVQKGIERISKILMPMLFIIMIILMINSLTLENHAGVIAGIEFYLKPDFVNLKPNNVLAAMGQAFFSLSLGCGTMCVYGSYATNHKGLPKSAAIIITLDTLVALIAGFIIFPAVFALGEEPAGGPALFFNILPKIFADMPGGRFFGFAFFFLVFIAAITSIISVVEVTLQTTIEKIHISRPLAVAIFTVLILGLGILVSLSQGAVKGLMVNGMDLVTFFDTIISQYVMPFVTIIACIIVGWLVKKEEINTDFADFRLRSVWVFFAKYITPVLVGLILIFGVFSFDGGFHLVNDLSAILTPLIVAICLLSVNMIYLAVKKRNAKKFPVLNSVKDINVADKNSMEDINSDTISSTNIDDKDN